MKLYLGAGSDRREGFKHADIMAFDGIDYVFDAHNTFPLDDGCCDYVYTQDFLEHIDPTKKVHVIKEIHRILSTGGFMEHRLPNGGSINDLASPTHLSHWVARTFEYFEQGNRRFEIDKKFNGWGDSSGFKMISVEERDVQNGVSQTLHVVMQKI